MDGGSGSLLVELIEDRYSILDVKLFEAKTPSDQPMTSPASIQLPEHRQGRVRVLKWLSFLSQEVKISGGVDSVSS